jgi:NCAIR mutase (PurE)-related protein
MRSRREILEDLLAGRISMEEAEARLSSTHVEVVDGLARLDPGREIRAGAPEVVLGQGKAPEWIAEILMRLTTEGKAVLATRVAEGDFGFIKEQVGDRIILEYHRVSRVVIARSPDAGAPRPEYGPVGILAAGTSDIPVAEEARITALHMRCLAETAYDVGVAGIHRLTEPLRAMIEKETRAYIVVAGMEGALPSVVKGLVSAPVIGVPTSIGYGFGGGGQAALMAMLQSCSPGLVVVNIDNGFGAGVAAALIARGAKGADRNAGTRT